MELVCPICGEPAERRTPRDKAVLMPLDRIRYRHRSDGGALCPVLGVTSSGQTGYIPALPIESRARR